MKLSQYFTLEELTRSATAVAQGLDNTPSEAVIVELTELAIRVDPLREGYGQPLNPTNGYRAPAVNKAVGGATNSSHMEGKAMDIADDAARSFARWCLLHLALLEQQGLWMEDPQWTSVVDRHGNRQNWVHLQTREVGVRVFIPSRATATAAKLLEQGGTA